MVGLAECDETTAEAWTALIHPDDRDRVSEGFRQAAQSGVPYDVEYRVRRDESALAWIRVTGRVEQDADGKPRRRLVGWWTDPCRDDPGRRYEIPGGPAVVS